MKQAYYKNIYPGKCYYFYAEDKILTKLKQK